MYFPQARRCRLSALISAGRAIWLAPLLAALVFATAVPAQADGAAPRWRMAAAIEARGEDNTPTGSVTDPGKLSLKNELQTIGVRAVLKATRTGAPAPAGGTAFATIILTNESQAKSIAAEIVLDSEISEIKSVTGGVAKDGANAASQVITVPAIGQKKPEQVTVELLLKEPVADAAKSNRLRITLRQPGVESAADTAEFSWKVIDCPGAYYGRLTQIRDANDEAIGELLKTVQKPDRDRPGRWLFTPSATSSRQTCLKSEKVYDRRSGRSYFRCLEFAGPDGGPDAETLKLEGEVIRFAVPLVSRRAVDPELSVKKNTGWVSYKIGTDIKSYLTQPKSPAICTGVPAFIGYYQGKIDDVNKRVDMFLGKAEEGLKVARARVHFVRETASAAAGGHPGWGAAALSLSAPAPDADLKALTQTLAALTANTSLQEAVASAASTFDALKAFKDYFSDKDEAGPPKEVASAIQSALATIEAADYVAAGAAPYSAIDRFIVGSLDAISKAHAEHCGCAN